MLQKMENNKYICWIYINLLINFRLIIYFIKNQYISQLKMQDDELNFDDIMEGKTLPKQKTQKKVEVKLTATDTRQRQQSCMIHQIDKSLLPENTKAPQNNFRVSLADMLSIDKTDESLERYKKNLLGNIKQEQLKEDQPAEVEILKVQVVCHGRPGGNIILDFKGKNISKYIPEFKIKEGAIYNLRLFFVVKYDIVYGLKMVNNVFKAFMNVQKEEQKLGTFAPQKEPHVFNVTAQEAPSGFMARGDYKGKAIFLDNDGIVHCQFEYILKIDKEW